MNKQEALVALLVKMREWEQPHEEVREADPGMVLEQMQEAFRDMDYAVGTREGVEFLTTIGAAALYLLVDEVTVVAGRSLEEWLADREPAIPFVSAGMPVLPEYADPRIQHPPGRSAPQPINGTIGKVRNA